VGKTIRDLGKFYDLKSTRGSSRVSYSRTGVISKVDRLGLTSSGYPSGTYFKDIKNLLELASRVSSMRTGKSSIELSG